MADNTPEDQRMLFRMGVSSGDIIEVVGAAGFEPATARLKGESSTS